MGRQPHHQRAGGSACKFYVAPERIGFKLLAIPDTSDEFKRKVKALVYCAAYSDGSIKYITDEQGNVYCSTNNDTPKTMYDFPSYELVGNAVKTKSLSFFGDALENIESVSSAAVINSENNHLQFFGADFKLGNFIFDGSDFSANIFANIGEGNILIPDTINAIGGNILGAWEDTEGNGYVGIMLRKFDNGVYKYQRLQGWNAGEVTDGAFPVFKSTTNPNQGFMLDGWLIMEESNETWAECDSVVYDDLTLRDAIEPIPAIIWSDIDANVYCNGYLVPWPVNGKNSKIDTGTAITTSDLTAAQASGDFVPLNYN